MSNEILLSELKESLQNSDYEFDNSIIKILSDIISFGDIDILRIKDNLTKITSTSQEFDIFTDEITHYIDFESLMSIRLQELESFLKDKKVLYYYSDESVRISLELYNLINKYRVIVEQNNNLSSDVGNAFESVKERIENIVEISNNIKDISKDILEVLLQKRNIYKDIQFNDIISIKPFDDIYIYEEVKVIDLQKYYLQDKALVFKKYNLLSDDFVKIEAYRFLEIKPIPALNMQYEIIIEVTDGKNYTYMNFKIFQNIYIPILGTPDLIILEDNESSVDLSKYFDGENLKFEITSFTRSNARIEQNMIFIQGSYSDDKYSVGIKARLDNTYSKEIFIEIIEKPSPPELSQSLVSNEPLVLEKDVVYIFNLSDFISHPSLQVRYHISGYPNNSTNISLVSSILEIQYEKRNIEYTINIEAVSIGSYANSSFFTSLHIKETLAPPELIDLFYNDINLSDANLEIKLDDNFVTYDLSLCFTGDELSFEIDVSLTNHPKFTFENNVLSIQGLYRDNTFEIVLIAYNSVKSSTLVFIINENPPPPPPITLKSNYIDTFYIGDETVNIDLNDYFNIFGNPIFIVQDDKYVISNSSFTIKGTLLDSNYQIVIIASNHKSNIDCVLTLTVYEYGIVPRILFEYIGTEISLLMYKSAMIDLSTYIYKAQNLQITYNIYNNINNLDVVYNNSVANLSTNSPITNTYSLNFGTSNNNGAGDNIVVKMVQINKIVEYYNFLNALDVNSVQNNMNNKYFLSFNKNVSVTSSGYIHFDALTSCYTSIENEICINWTVEVVFRITDNLLNCVVCKTPFGIQIKVENYKLGIFNLKTNIFTNLLYTKNVQLNTWYHVFIMQNGKYFVNDTISNIVPFESAKIVNGDIVIGVSNFIGDFYYFSLSPDNEPLLQSNILKPTNPNVVLLKPFDMLLDISLNSTHSYILENYFMYASHFTVDISTSNPSFYSLLLNNVSITINSNGKYILSLKNVYIDNFYTVIVTAFNPENMFIQTNLDISYSPRLITANFIDYNIYNDLTIDLNLVFKFAKTYTIETNPSNIYVASKFSISNNILTVSKTYNNISYSLIIYATNSTNIVTSYTIYVSEYNNYQTGYLPSAVLSTGTSTFTEYNKTFTFGLQYLSYQYSTSVFLFDDKPSTTWIFSPYTLQSNEYVYTGYNLIPIIVGSSMFIQCTSSRFICVGFEYTLETTNVNGPKEIVIIATNDRTTYSRIYTISSLTNNSQKITWANTTEYKYYYVIFTKASATFISLTSCRFIITI